MRVGCHEQGQGQGMKEGMSVYVRAWHVRGGLRMKRQWWGCKAGVRRVWRGVDIDVMEVGVGRYDG